MHRQLCHYFCDNRCLWVCRCTRCLCRIAATVYRAFTTVWSTAMDQFRFRIRVRSRSSSGGGRMDAFYMNRLTHTYDRTSMSMALLRTLDWSTSRFLAAHYWHYCSVYQEARLSQTGCAMLRDIKNFAKSLKVVQGHSKLHRCVGRV